MKILKDPSSGKYLFHFKNQVAWGEIAKAERFSESEIERLLTYPFLYACEVLEAPEIAEDLKEPETPNILEDPETPNILKDPETPNILKDPIRLPGAPAPRPPASNPVPNFARMTNNEIRQWLSQVQKQTQPAVPADPPVTTMTFTDALLAQERLYRESAGVPRELTAPEALRSADEQRVLMEQQYAQMSERYAGRTWSAEERARMTGEPRPLNMIPETPRFTLNPADDLAAESVFLPVFRSLEQEFPGLTMNVSREYYGYFYDITLLWRTWGYRYAYPVNRLQGAPTSDLLEIFRAATRSWRA